MKVCELMAKLLLHDRVQDNKDVMLRQIVPFFKYADMAVLEVGNEAETAAALAVMQALEKKKLPVSVIFPFSLLQCESFKKKDKDKENPAFLSGFLNKAGKAAAGFIFSVPHSEHSPQKRGKSKQGREGGFSARMAAFTSQYSSFLLLPYSQKDCESESEIFYSRFMPWLNFAKENGFKGALLFCDYSPQKKRAKFIALLGEFLQQAQKKKLQSGIIGNLQLPDIPRLLPYKPDYLGFSFQDLLQNAEEKEGDFAQIQNFLRQIRRFIPHIDEQLQNDKNTEKQNLGADKIIVSDFVVPVHIGAYRHEKNASQPVCFNVTAEVARISAAPYHIDNIFSYDIILDAIERLAAVGHIELAENLAEQLAAFLLEFPRVRKVTVRVEKLNLAPRAVGVEITRTR